MKNGYHVVNGLERIEELNIERNAMMTHYIETTNQYLIALSGSAFLDYSRTRVGPSETGYKHPVSLRFTLVPKTGY